MDESLQLHLQQQNEVVDVLRRARALLDTPEKWSKNGSGLGVGRFCAGYALNIAGNYQGDRAWYWLRKAVNLPTECPLFLDVPDWNDAPERTHAEVLQAFDRAIALAEQA